MNSNVFTTLEIMTAPFPGAIKVERLFPTPDFINANIRVTTFIRFYNSLYNISHHHPFNLKVFGVKYKIVAIKFHYQQQFFQTSKTEKVKGKLKLQTF